MTGAGGASASAGDFVAGVLPSGTLTFAPGQTIKLITILVRGDTTVEGTERFRVNLNTPTGAMIDVANAIGVIVNDDAAADSVFATLDAYEDIRKRFPSAALVDQTIATL